MRVGRLILFFMISIGIVPATVLAQPNDALARLRQCAVLDYDDQRLACYDSVMRAPLQETATRESPSTASPAVKTTAPPPQASTAAPSRPSSSPPANDANFGLKPKPPVESPKLAKVTITRLRRDLRGEKYIFTTDSGQLWQQTDDRRARYDDVPFKAEIRAAAMGSFFLKPESGGTSVRVRRIR